MTSFNDARRTLINAISKVEELQQVQGFTCNQIKTRIFTAKTYYDDASELETVILGFDNEEFTSLFYKSRRYIASLIVVLIQNFLVEDDSSSCVTPDDRVALKDIVDSLDI